MERVKSSNGKHDKVLADGYAYNYFRSAKDGSVKTVTNIKQCTVKLKLRVIEATSTYTLVGAHIESLTSLIQEDVMPIKSAPA